MDKNKSSIEDYIRLEVMGQGSFGVVYKCKDKRTEKIVALKKVVYRNKDEGVPSTSIREISTLQRLKHPNIVSLEEIMLEEDRMYMVFEFLPVDLGRYICSIPDDELMDVAQQKFFLYQILQGTCFCHQRGIIHRDLKPENLLIDESGRTIKLADFGLARAIDVPMKCYSQDVVTLWYRAPELLLGVRRYTLGVDIWSIGCIFAQMATKTPLFPGDSEIDQITRIFKIMSTPTEETWKGVSSLLDPEYDDIHGHWKEDCLNKVLENYIDPQGIRVLREMLAYDPANRITAKELLKDAYFDDVDRKKLPAGDYDGTLQFSSNE